MVHNSTRRSLVQSGAACVAIAASKKAIASSSHPNDDPKTQAHEVLYKTLAVGPADVFYRSAGSPTAPVVLLLHGYPTDSHLFRNLIPLLAGHYRVIAPDMPGFGLTKTPPRGQFTYSFDEMAKVIDGFVDALELKRFALYLFDYGAPVGFRLATAHPERITAIVSQNGNAYVEGLGAAWAPVRKLWADPSQTNRDAMLPAYREAGIKAQYFGDAYAERVSPDGWGLDLLHFQQRIDNDDIQTDLFYDYRNNVALYPAWQAYLRAHKPPLLAIWGKNDPWFIPPGAEAFRRDVPDAEVRFLDAGHFALETNGPEIAEAMLHFLNRVIPDKR